MMTHDCLWMIRYDDKCRVTSLTWRVGDETVPAFTEAAVFYQLLNDSCLACTHMSCDDHPVVLR